MPMTTRIWSKPDTQHFIKRLRDAGYTVDRVPNGYVCQHVINANCVDVVFKAMNGRRGYLCSINSDYCEGINEDIALAR